MFRVRPLLMLSLLTVGCGVGAEEPYYRLTTGRVPEYFYHWTDRVRLESHKAAVLPRLPLTDKSSRASQQFVPLQGQLGTFVWTHPVTGSAAVETESYGYIPIQIKTRRSDLTILELTTVGDRVTLDANIEMNKVDVVHHVHWLDHPRLVESVAGPPHWEGGPHSIRYEEWIILKPFRVVESYTSDPSVLGPLLRENLARMNDLVQSASGRKLRHPFNQDELHFKGEKSLFNDPLKSSLQKFMIEQMLENMSTIVPEVWKKNTPMNCGFILSGQFQ